MKSWVLLLAACWAVCVTQTSTVQGWPQVGGPSQAFARPSEAASPPEVPGVSEAPDVTTARVGQVNESIPNQDDGQDDGEGITTTFNPDSGLDPRGDTNVTSTTIPTTSTSANGTTEITTESTTASSNTTQSTPATTTPLSTTAVPPTNATTKASTTSAIPVTVTMPSPDENRGFEGWSFFGGIVLTLVVFAIGFVGFKYYTIRRSAHGGNYNRF